MIYYADFDGDNSNDGLTWKTRVKTTDVLPLKAGDVVYTIYGTEDMHQMLDEFISSLHDESDRNKSL